MCLTKSCSCPKSDKILQFKASDNTNNRSFGFMTFPVRFRLLIAGIALLTLAACDNAEERAQGHYQRGMELLEAGEDRKAMLEFKNSLQLDEDAIQPRLEFARLLLKYGERGIVPNFLKVLESDPDHLESRVKIARHQIAVGDDGASEHLKVAARVAPDSIEVRSLQAAFEQKMGDSQKAATMAEALLKEDPGNVIAANIMVTHMNEAQDYAGANMLLDEALAANPEALELHVSKLKALEGQNDQAAIGEQLARMAGIFPENADILRGQVQWFLNQGEPENAISKQRDVARIFPETPGHALNLVALLLQFEGADAANAELERLSSGDQHSILFGRAHADFEFQQNNAPAAIARLETLAQTDLPANERNDVRAQLANFLRATGEADQAQELAQAIIKEDSEHVEALRLRSLYAIDNDKPHEAIGDLRVALSKKAQDPATLMLLALAHERNGSLGLAQERLALAVQASGAGVKESLAYADFLARQGKHSIAISVLDDALDKKGERPELLAGLGQVNLSMSDWNGASGVVKRLIALDNPQASTVAQDLQVAILNGERKFDQSIGVLREMWDVAGERSSAMENLVRNLVQTGQTDEAAKFLEGILENDPDSLRANLLRGALHAFEGQADQAEAIYRQIIEQHPNVESGYGALSALLMSQARLEEADEVTRAGIENAANTERLLFVRAGRLEQNGEFEAAIAIYDQLYSANKISDVLANNLASLLSEYREDEESLERAYNISKRLRASEQPAFQDTYGWVLYKRGEFELALPPLKAAADGVRTNAVVQYHLGMVYDKLGQKEEAIPQMELALKLGENQILPQLENARAVLERLKAE